jgi:hypothetical protein
VGRVREVGRVRVREVRESEGRVRESVGGGGERERESA